MSEELVSEAAVPFSVVCAICSDIAVPPVANIPAVIMTTRYTTFKNNLGFILLIFKESQ
jgi:siroheme synthase